MVSIRKAMRMRMVLVLLALLAAGYFAGFALGVNCTVKCNNQVAAVRFYSSASGDWLCCYATEGMLCEGEDGGHQFTADVFTYDGDVNEKCKDDSNAATGSVKWKVCIGETICSSNCTGQNNTDYVQAAHSGGDGTGCSDVISGKTKNCVGSS